ncbi:MAG: hypothetical protein MUE63_14870, partial [Xanthomonadales bacterium]|nr:hypothetical protein [Xanthomonadales bacterium]
GGSHRQQQRQQRGERESELEAAAGVHERRLQKPGAPQQTRPVWCGQPCCAAAEKCCFFRQIRTFRCRPILHNDIARHGAGFRRKQNYIRIQ